MKKTTIKLILLGVFLFTSIAKSQCVTGTKYSKTTPKRDLRGVFVASVFSLDWTTNRLATPLVQQAELIDITYSITNNTSFNL